MRFPCEIAVREFLPPLRSLTAKHLIEEHGFTQTAAALRLGVSQASVNCYLNLKRGQYGELATETENIDKTAVKVAKGLAEGQLTQVEVLTEICTMCCHLRERGSICRLHEAMMPALKGQDCKACCFVR
jgi:predicted transcriptional regulator